MWWEILPAAGLVWVCMTMPMITVPTFNYFVLGKPCKRGCATDQDLTLWRRDQALDPYKKKHSAGNGHNIVGLEGIPDGK